jgi:hypothetical protein
MRLPDLFFLERYQPVPMNQLSLFDAFKFDQIDLLANQKGHLSQGQKDNLSGIATSTIIIGGFFFLVITFGITIPFIRNYVDSRNSNLLPIIFTSAIIGLILAAIIISAVTEYLMDLKSNKALSISGSVTLTASSTKVRARLQIKDKSFRIPEVKSDMFQPDAQYIVYYT